MLWDLRWRQKQSAVLFFTDLPGKKKTAASRKKRLDSAPNTKHSLWAERQKSGSNVLLKELVGVGWCAASRYSKLQGWFVFVWGTCLCALTSIKFSVLKWRMKRRQCPNKHSCKSPRNEPLTTARRNRLGVPVWCTYREQHDGDGQSDGSENSQTHQQQHGVELVNLGEGVEQLCLHVVCGNKGKICEQLVDKRWQKLWKSRLTVAARDWFELTMCLDAEKQYVRLIFFSMIRVDYHCFCALLLLP